MKLTLKKKTGRRVTRSTRLIVLSGCLAMILGACGSDGSNRITLDASIDGTVLRETSARHPVRLKPKSEQTLSVRMKNDTDSPVTVQRVRLEGQMLSLKFLSYDVRVQTVLAPGTERTLQVPLDFFDLDRQATGYLRGNLRLFDENRNSVAKTPVFLDVRGSIFSTMGLFALLLLVLVVAATVRNLRDTKRRRLPEKRFARGLRFLVPGLGIGLLLSVGFAILRIFPLPAVGWVPLTLIPALATFAIGYFLAPGPAAEDYDGLPDEDEDDLEDDDLINLASEESSPVGSGGS